MDHRILNLLSFNVRSLNDKSRQIDLTKTFLFNNIEVGFIQECHLRRNRIANSEGYNAIFDHSNVGVAIFIKKSIHYTRIVTNDVRVNIYIIQIVAKHNGLSKIYALGSIYIPCNYPSL